MITCKHCGSFIMPAADPIPVDILDRYYLSIPRGCSNDELEATVQPLFAELLNDIRAGADTEWFSRLDVVIQEETREYSCSRCGGLTDHRMYFSIQDHFSLFLERYVAFLLENLLVRYVGAAARDLGVDLRSPGHVQVLLKGLPEDLSPIRDLVTRLIAVQQCLPVVGGLGGDVEVIEWIIQQLKTEILPIVITLVVTGSVSRLSSSIRSIATKTKIRKRIKTNSTYWADISFDDLERHFTVPRSFKGSREELIEKIIVDKIDTFKKTLIEKVRKKNEATK